MRHIICMAAVLAALPIAALAQGGPAGVSTDFVETREVSETIPVFAEVVATRESEVAVQIAGIVTGVDVEVGDLVEQGAILATLDSEVLQIELKSARASETEARAGIAVAEADLTLAERGFGRVRGLQGTNAFSQGQFEDREGALARARGQLAQAEARLLSAEAALARAVYDLDRAAVRAPFAGTVLDVRIDPGEYVQTGAAVAVLVDTEDLEVQASVPAAYVGPLAPGQVLSGLSENGSKIELVLRAVLPTENSGTRTRPVRFEATFDAGAGPVAVGQSVTVDIPVTEARAAVLVPKDAVTEGRGGWTVFVHENGKAVPRTVTIGTSFGPAFEVIDGLEPGAEVVVRGNERLRPMQDIAPTPVRPAPDARQGATEAGSEPTARQQAAAATLD